LTLVTEKSDKTRKLLTVGSWPADEISTRNCCHCLVSGGGIYVGCRLGHTLGTNSHKKRRELTYNGVVRMPQLLKPCQGCQDFCNDWR